ncbi:glycoside hydrolase domain-containing protein [Cohnella cholangitidis]|uniref:DUF1906 domain-containing protein n=1 Tax=Cohnella cholangitidis TaxID=2598458 RepID=A0A7G5BY09_9BACL|nr:glycoside hydrolase domain-containing protein [Cohnella cholangitidis]QMV41843.1 DUF1906 domain-containing protein [Cohnella cholangitidis]
MDQMVHAVQGWLNDTYENNSNFTPVAEDGITGWGTIRGLITALQIEIGVSAPNGSFGPQTFSLCPTISELSTNINLVKIVQGALFCKGYNPTGFTGTYGNGTKAAIESFQSDAGFENPDGVTTPLFMKALLTMDAFVNLGDSELRTIQQNLNRKYGIVFGPDIGLVPCDGLRSRTLAKALIYGVQVEEGIPVPNGTFGPQTLSLLPTLSEGSTKADFIKLLRYGLFLNNFYPYYFTGVFDAALKGIVKNFQSFVKLTADGIAGKQTLASLFISYGDKNRAGTACDCVTTITPARAQTLFSSGYRIIGRYIVGDWKKIKPGELETIFNAGLKVFPIYQSSGSSVNYFTAYQGARDAVAAKNAASSYGFKTNAIIYFAVDFDCSDGQVTSNILPYFRALSNTMVSGGAKYKIGIYGPRNVCTRVSNEGLAVTSFVSDMSSGFSGNMGYPLPSNWAFDQITTISVGSGDGLIEIDKNIASGRDPAVNEVDTGYEPPLSKEMQNEVFISHLQDIHQLAMDYTNNDIYMANQKTLHYLRHVNYDGLLWDTVAGNTDDNFINHVKTTMNNPPLETFYDPETGIEIDIPHWAATANSYTYLLDDVVWAELSGAIGDLITCAGDSVKAYNNGLYPSVYLAAKALINSEVGISTFSNSDLLSDIDAYLVSVMMNSNYSRKLPEIFKTYYTDINHYKNRFANFTLRYGHLNQLEENAYYLLTTEIPLAYANVRDLIFKPAFNVVNYSNSQAAEIAQAYREIIESKI